MPQHRSRHLIRIDLLMRDLAGVLDVRVDFLFEKSSNPQHEVVRNENRSFDSRVPSLFPSASVPVRPRQYEVVGHHHVELIARPYLQSRRDVHPALETALRNLSELLARRRAAHLTEQ